jgi:hypothetical protein
MANEADYKIIGSRYLKGSLKLKPIAATTVPTPAAGEYALFCNSADNKISVKDENGDVTALSFGVSGQYEVFYFTLAGVIDTTTTTALKDYCNLLLRWFTPDAEAVTFAAVVQAAVTTGPAPTLDLKNGATSMITAAISVTTTWTSATIDTANDDITLNDDIEVSLDKGTGDAEKMTVVFIAQYK